MASTFDPATAVRRPDLAFLRHRTRPRPRAAAEPVESPRPAVPAGTVSLDLSDSPASPVQAARPAPAAVSLDLSDSPASPVQAARPAPAAIAGLPAVVAPSPSGRTVLTPKSPVVTLSRLQSGLGTLAVRPVVPSALDQLRIGCAYQLVSGECRTVQSRHGDGAGLAASSPSGPAAGARQLVSLAQHGGQQEILFNLRHGRQLARAVVYGYSETGSALEWGGSLITTLFGGDRIELPLERPTTAGALVLLSIYNIEGEFVIRAEMELIAGAVRQACTSYGFDTLTWLDDRTPVN